MTHSTFRNPRIARCTQIINMGLLVILLSGSTSSEWVSSLSYPEGPLKKADGVYFVQYGAHAVSKVREGNVLTVWQQDGCGPASIIDAQDDGLWVACYDSNSLLNTGVVEF